MRRSSSNPQLMGNNITAVYVGAGIDVLPLLLFRNIRLFIYIDSADNDYEFRKTIGNIGYVKQHSQVGLNPREYIHNSRGTKVLYFMNNSFPDKLDSYAIDCIKQASILICCGYNPDSSILDLMKTGPKIFIGNNKTKYDGEKHGVCRKILDDERLFSEYFRFDIPDLYPYQTAQYVEEHHIVKMPVTRHYSLDQLSIK